VNDAATTSVAPIRIAMFIDEKNKTDGPPLGGLPAHNGQAAACDQWANAPNGKKNRRPDAF
jgi:hypothetical protein